jgi:hypothetical protein
MGEVIDPLGDVTMWWLWNHSRDLCDCPAKNDSGVLHWWTCASTPIWRRMGPGLVSDALNQIAMANLAQTQTAIKCAECGRERLERDLLVIYQAPIRNYDPSDNLWKYPKNIVKAVCPEHNRVGSVGYQQVAASGYGN